MSSIAEVAKDLNRWFTIIETDFKPVIDVFEDPTEGVFAQTGRHARTIIDSDPGCDGAMYQCLALFLFFGSRYLKREIRTEDWKDALVNTDRLQGEVATAVSSNATGLTLGTTSSILKDMLDGYIRSSGVAGHDTSLTIEQRKQPLGHALKWATRYLLVHALEYHEVSTGEPEQLNLGWIKRLVQACRQ